VSVEIVTVGETEVIVTVTADPTIELVDPSPAINIEIQQVGAQGPAAAETFEMVSSNLKSYPHAISYAGSKVSSVTYDLPGALQIVKTLGYTGEFLTSIVLSGDTPDGIDLTKTLTYDNGVLISVNYS
jgi:hypothetical protein